jgi:hypothetical protein
MLKIIIKYINLLSNSASQFDCACRSKMFMLGVDYQNFSWTITICSILINYHLSKKIKLLKNDECNHIYI